MRISKCALKNLASDPWVKLPDWLTKPRTKSTCVEPAASNHDPAQEWKETDSSGRQYPLPEPAQDPTKYWRWLDFQLGKEEDNSDKTNNEYGLEELVHSS